MEKQLVLSKFFKVSERLRVDRARYQKEVEAAATTDAEKGEAAAMESLSPSARGLLCLLVDAESVNQRTLAKQMNISAQAVSETIKKLVQGGYITKVCGAQNNENLIALTPYGLVIAKRLDRRIKEHAETVLKALDETELQTLYDLLVKITEE